MVGTFYRSRAPGEPFLSRSAQPSKQGRDALHHQAMDPSTRSRLDASGVVKAIPGGERPAGRIRRTARSSSAKPGHHVRKSSSPTAARSPSASSAPAANWASRRWSCIRKPTAKPNVKLADESVCIGPGSIGTELPERAGIISAAEVTDAAGHPPGLRLPLGKCRFRRARRKSGFVFIGPRPKPSA